MMCMMGVMLLDHYMYTYNKANTLLLQVTCGLIHVHYIHVDIFYMID